MAEFPLSAGGLLHLGQPGRREVLHLADKRGAPIREPVVDPDPVAAGGD